MMLLFKFQRADSSFTNFNGDFIKGFALCLSGDPAVREINTSKLKMREIKSVQPKWCFDQLQSCWKRVMISCCDQSSHRHQFTAKQVELYYLERIFWNLKNAKKEVFIHQITLADPRLQHLDITYSSTAADFEQWKKHQLAPFYVLRTLIGLNLWWLLIIVGLKIKARIQLKQ